MGSIFAGKRVIVTGASQGIGASVAKSFVNKGASVVLVARTKSNLEGVKAELKDYHQSKSYIFVADVSKAEEVRGLEQFVLKELAGVDIIVNCAGITIKKSVVDLDIEEWNKVLDINLKSVFLMAKTFGRHLFRDDDSDYSKFIAIGSVGSSLSIPTSGAYCASKGGLVQLMKVLANEWAKQKVNVNSIIPGYIATPLSKGVLENEEVKKGVVTRIPLGEIGEVEDVASAISFLASQESNYITGICMNVDGGYLSAAYTQN